MRGALLGGLAGGALLVSGCGQELGSTIAAGKGECVPADTIYHLAPGNRLFVSGDIKYGGSNNDVAITQRLQVRNAGKGVLKLHADAGKLKSGEIAVTSIDEDAPATADIAVRPGSEDAFTFEQGPAKVLIDPSMGAAGQIALKVTVTCPVRK